MKFSILSLILFFVLNLNAQQNFREFGTNDSTTYILNNDTTIVVSRNKLYYNTAGEITELYDFSTADTTMFIRDFDIISDDFWYLIYGGRYWGGSSVLYKTTNKGVSWISDTTIFIATHESAALGLIAEPGELYQLQRISVDTLLLFVSYYQSGIFYSVDAGLSWDLWFANAIANYRGLFECETDYFLWQQEGDGFRPSMFSFSKDLFLLPNTNDVWIHWSGSYVYHPDCYNGENPDCIFAPSSMTGHDQFLFFENYINDNCSDVTVGIPANLAVDNLKIYPNPSLQGKFFIEWANGSSIPVNYKIYTVSGQLIRSNKIQSNNSVNIDLSNFNQGLYFLVVNYSDKIIVKKIVY